MTNAHIDVQADHYQLVREMGAASTVLLKNVNNTLPLKKPRSIVLIGSDAGSGTIGPNQFGDQVRMPISSCSYSVLIECR
jgi:beta-glucosidase-like glycosyl hydrolase